MIIAIFGAAFLAFVFAGLAAAVPALNRVCLRGEALRQDRDAIALESLMAHPERLAIVLAILNAFSKILALWLVYSGLHHFLGTFGAVFASALCLPAFFLVFEVVPKSLAQNAPIQKLTPYVRLLRIFDRLLGPPISWLVSLIDAFLPDSHRHHSRKLVTLSTLRRAVNRAVQQEALSPLQKHFIHSALNARKLSAASLAAPPGEIPVLPAETPIENLMRHGEERGVLRVPVATSDGQLLGVVHLFDLAVDGIVSGRAQSYARSIPIISPDTPALDALIKMRSCRSAMASVPCQDAATFRLLPAESLVRRIFLGTGKK